MKTLKLALPLALAASLLSACGGGGGSNSPDRPGKSLDTSSLKIRFVGSGPNRNVLAGTGSGTLSAQMIGLSKDGIAPDPEPPEVNVTKNTEWSIIGEPDQLGEEPIAELAEAVRNAGSIGDVIDILSKVRLSSEDTQKQLTLRGDYNDVIRTADFFVRPPIPKGAAFISGPDVIALDPMSSEVPTNVAYQLLQPLKEISQPENLTRNGRFCSDSQFLKFNAPQPPESDFAAVTLVNPFLDSQDDLPVAVTIRVIRKKDSEGKYYTCDMIGKDINPADGEEEILDPPLTNVVQLIPAVVAQGGVKVCAVVNAADDACDAQGSFDNAQYLADCQGREQASVDVPAGERVQMVAELKYTNPGNVNQAPFFDYRCMASSRLSWSANPTTIFTDGLDATDGSATLISRADYLEIADSDPKSVVTGSFKNSASATPVTDDLTLNLVDSTVTAIEIERLNPDPNDPNGPDADTLFINILKQPLEYRAVCTYGEADPIVATCANACVGWSVGDGDILTATPATGSSTSISSTDGTPGTSSVTATYTCDSGISDSRTIVAVDDPVVELHLLQASNGNEPEIHQVDPFSCVGRTDVVGTLADGNTVIRGDQQFHAHALFESHVDDYNNDPSTLPEVTDADAVVFSSLPGYANGDGSCTTGLPLTIPEVPELSGDSLLSSIPIIGNVLDFYLGDVVDILTIPLDQLPGVPGGGVPSLSQTPAATFSGETKGKMESRGLLRLSTVCAQAYVDADGSGNFTEGDEIAKESSTVLVLPAADDQLLNFSNEVCEILEPALTLGANTPAGDVLPAGVVVPLVYGVSLIADPVLTQLATNDDGGALPVEEIITALITGSFSDLSIPGQPEFTDAPFGLGALTGVLFQGQGDIPGLELLINTVDQCAIDPLTTSVNTLLRALLTLDAAGVGNLTDGVTAQDCTDVFGDPTQGGLPGLPDLGGGIPVPSLP